MEEENCYPLANKKFLLGEESNERMNSDSKTHFKITDAQVSQLRITKKEFSSEQRQVAKMYLLAMGWNFKFKYHRGSYDTLYYSPTGKCFQSLVSVWKALTANSGDTNSLNVLTKGSAKTTVKSQEKKKKREACINGDSSYPGVFTKGSAKGPLKSHEIKKEREARKFEMVNAEEVNCVHEEVVIENVTNVTTSCLDLAKKYGFRSKKRKVCIKEEEKSKQKRYRKDAPSGNCRKQVLAPTNGKTNNYRKAVRSVLALLIERGLVKENQSVFYFNRKENYPLARGVITREGILCSCCRRVYTITKFEGHAGSTLRRPSANILLENGTSLSQLQMQLSEKSSRKRKEELPPKNVEMLEVDNDEFCSGCCEGGNLVMCDRCPASFHQKCGNIEVIPEGDWFCKRCSCSVCGKSEYNKEKKGFNEPVLVCLQCECLYHARCVSGTAGEDNNGLVSGPSSNDNWFCTSDCFEVFSKLRSLVGKVNDISDGYSWTIIRSEEEENHGNFDEAMAENHSKLCVALKILYDCFIPIIDPRTGKDTIEGMLFNRRSGINRWNFQRFYTMILEKEDALTTVVIFRVHGKRIAEMPLIATRPEYQRKGMAHLLMKELEKVLLFLGVEKLVLSAMEELKPVWENSFGFRKLNLEELHQITDLNIHAFQNIHFLEKFLTNNEEKHNRLSSLLDKELFPLV